MIPQKVSKLGGFVRYFLKGFKYKKPRIFINSLKFMVLDKNKYYRYISCVTFLLVRYFGLSMIHQFGELDLLKTTQTLNQSTN